MPGRYTITAEQEQISERFNVEVDDTYKRRYNAAPTQSLPVISTGQSKKLSYYFWGLIPQWSKNKAVATKLFNARADSLNDKISFKNSLKSRRCIIPIDGYYEWKAISKKSKIPYRITLKTGELFSIAGLWESYEEDNGNEVFTFTVITTEANAEVAKIHDRMPVILTPETEKIWLDLKANEDEVLNILKPFPANLMSSYAVSSRVNEVANDDPTLIKPAPPADQFGNYSLFD